MPPCVHCLCVFQKSEELAVHLDHCKPFVILTYANGETVVHRDGKGLFRCNCDSDVCARIYKTATAIEAHVATDCPKFIPIPEIVLVPSSSEPVVSNHDAVLATMKKIEAQIEDEQRNLPQHPGECYPCVEGPLGTDDYLITCGLYYEPNWRFIICPGCHIALAAQNAVTHIKSTHPLAKIDPDEFSSTCVKLGIVSQLPDIQEVVTPISGLLIYPSALQCATKGCSKLYINAKSMKRHHKQVHADATMPSSWRSTPAQKLDHLFHKSLFPVHLPVRAQQQAPSTWLQELESIVDSAIETKTLEASDGRNINNWLRATRWPSHVAPFDVHKLQKLVAPLETGEFPKLKEAVTQKFAEDVELIAETPLLSLQKLNTDDPIKTGIINTPFRVHQNGKETLERYSAEVLRFLAFLLRDHECYKLPLPPSIVSIISALRDPPRNSPTEYFVERIQKLLFLVWSSRWVPSSDNTLGDPTICYIALSSIKQDLRWAHPKEITQPLARLTYCLRLVMLRQAHAHAKADITSAIDSLAPFYTEKVDSSFNAIRSLQHLASSIAYSTVSLPVAFWPEDGEKYRSVIFAGAKITMSQIRNMGAKLILNTYNFLCINVFLNKPIFIDPVFIYDELNEHSPGYSFLDDPSNASLGRYKNTLLQAILDDKALRQEFIVGFHPGTGNPLWNLPRLRLWYRHYCDLQLQFAMLIQILGGAPARGSELLCIQFRNTPSQIRGLYKMHHNWVLICQYSKTSSLTGHDKFIPHGIDAFTGDMLFHSLVCALPFAKLVAAIIFPKDAGVQKLLHSTLFPNSQKLYETEQLSSSMKVVSLEFLGTSLTVSQWRQLFVAIRRKHCSDFDAALDFESVDTVGALQAGHNRQTENRIYGLTPDSFTHYSEEVIKAFLDFSKKWARFMNVPPGHLNLSYGLLSTPSTYKPYLPVDDGTAPLPGELRQNEMALRLQEIQNITSDVGTRVSKLESGFERVEAMLMAMSKGVDYDDTEPRNAKVSIVPGMQTSSLPDLAPGMVLAAARSPPPLLPPVPVLPEPLFTSWPPPDDESEKLRQLERRCLSTLRDLLKDPKATWRSEAQRYAILAASSRCNDVVAILPTGGGKTMVPLIASLHSPNTVTIFILPFTSLIYDYQRRLDKYDIKHMVFTSQTPRISGKEPVVLVSAEVARTVHFVQCVQEAHQRVSIPAIVLDEAQTVAIAKQYRDSLKGIYTLRSIPAQFILLSGTIPPISLDSILHDFHLHEETIIIRTTTNRPELAYLIQPAAKTEEDLIVDVYNLYRSASAEFTPGQRALVYVPFISLGYAISQRLGCDFYNGNDIITPALRREMYESWVTGNQKVMVCTSAFGAGNDYDQVSLIIHAGVPFEMINYIQEVGRAGRDGNPAKCYLIPRVRKQTFVNPGEIDHGGVAVMHHMVFNSDLCIRFTMSEFTDGEGMFCSENPANQPCSRCIKLSSASTIYPSGSGGKRKDPPSDNSDVDTFNRWSSDDSLPIASSSFPRQQVYLTPTEPNLSQISGRQSQWSQGRPAAPPRQQSMSRSSPFPSSSSSNKVSGRHSSSLSLKSQPFPSSSGPRGSLLPQTGEISSRAPKPSHPLQSPPNVFVAQADSTKRRRVEELAQSEGYIRQIRNAFHQIGDDCTCCLVLGQDARFHLGNNCPSLPEGFSGFKDWRDLIKFNRRVHGQTCFVCYFPMGEGSAHPELKSGASDCPYRDRIGPLLWTLYHHAEKRRSLEEFFEVQFPTPDSFARWICAKPLAGHRNNSMAVFLWFAKYHLPRGSTIAESR